MQVIVLQLRFTNPLIIIKSVPSCLCRTRTLEDNAGILMIAEPHAPPAPKTAELLSSTPTHKLRSNHSGWSLVGEPGGHRTCVGLIRRSFIAVVRLKRPQKTWLLARYYCPVKKQPSCIFFLRRKPTIWTSFLRNKITTTRGRHFDSRTEILQAIPRPIIIFRMFAHMHSNEVFAEDLVHLLKHRFWPKLEFKNKANTQRSYLESHKPKLA